MNARVHGNMIVSKTLDDTNIVAFDRARIRALQEIHCRRLLLDLMDKVSRTVRVTPQNG